MVTYADNGPTGHANAGLSDIAVSYGIDTGRLIVLPDDTEPYVVDAARRLLERLPELVRNRRAALSDDRIDQLTALLLPNDPFTEVEARIDEDNARLRARFLTDTPCLDSAAVHHRAGRGGRNPNQTANTWKRKGRIFAVTLKGRDLFPAFQFDETGEPKPVIAAVLAALPATMTAWQRAFWFVSGNGHLEGAAPVERLQSEHALVGAARQADAVPAG